MLSLKQPRTPWYAKAWIALVVAYAVSPLDLIPDPIPVLGYLDDALLLPLGIVLAIKLVPDDVLDECRAATPPATSRALAVIGTTLVIGMWAACAWLLWRWLA